MLNSKIKLLVLLLIFTLGKVASVAQSGEVQPGENQPGNTYTNPDFSARCVFWNVENLFDPRNDSLTQDDEFTPGGLRHWTWNRFRNKELLLYKTLIALGEGTPPAIIGLAEIENKYTVRFLCDSTPLSMAGYAILHQDSPDQRGIDVALLYRQEYFHLLTQDWLPVSDSASSYQSRDILYAKGILPDNDTLHVFVNHWPSRYKGKKVSEPRRLNAAKVLAAKLAHITTLNSKARILIMGDFNDSPDDESLKMLSTTGQLKLRWLLKGKPSYKYQGIWYEYDQIISSAYLKVHQAEVFKAGWLLTEDKNHLGLKPYRTYLGYRYQGGASDHLPVYADLLPRKPGSTR